MRVAIALGVIACVALAVLWSRGDESSSRAAEVGEGGGDRAESGASSEDDPAAAAGLRTAPPVRMSADPSATAAAEEQPGSQAFAAEAHDPPWAEEKEAQVREVLSGLREQLGDRVAGAEVRGVDCKSSQCEIVVGGSDSAAVVRLVDAIGDERGFYGVAEGVQLARRGDDILLYVRFRR